MRRAGRISHNVHKSFDITGKYSCLNSTQSIKNGTRGAVFDWLSDRYHKFSKLVHPVKIFIHFFKISADEDIIELMK